MRANTRREYRRLLVNFALSYFDREVRVGEMDRAAVQRFVDWLTTRPGRDGRLRDRSISNALTPLRLALDAAVAEGATGRKPRRNRSCCRDGGRDLYEVGLAALFCDAVFLSVRPNGPKEGVLVAWGFTEQGERVLLSVMLGMRESHEDWLSSAAS